MGIKDLLCSLAGSQRLQDWLDGDACPLDDGFAQQHGWVGTDPWLSHLRLTVNTARYA
jgi:hypothetical protein